MKRGFKASAERLSQAEREKLGLTVTCRLDPVVLAASKGIEVMPLSGLPGVADHHRRQLQETDEAAFSACTVVREERHLVVVNDAHELTRQANSIAHELAHILLDHEAQNAFDGYGSRHVTKNMEDEADWLAGCLLVPGPGITTTLRSCGNDLSKAAEHYGISIDLMRWRVNMTRWKPRKRKT